MGALKLCQRQIYYDMNEEIGFTKYEIEASVERSRWFCCYLEGRTGGAIHIVNGFYSWSFRIVHFISAQESFVFLPFLNE